MKSTTLQGIVTPFSQNGRKLGYPTANIKSPTKLKDGVYLGYADLELYKHHPATIFIGTPTTVGDTERRVEAYLLDIDDKDYYGQHLKLELLHYVRLNQNFATVAELIQQLQEDELYARSWFKKQTKP